MSKSTPVMKSLVAAGILAITTLPAFAESKIMVHDAYARAAGMSAKAGAAFMEIMNQGDEDDRLIEARADISKVVQLHTHKIDDNGVAKMMHVPEGFVIPAGGQHVLKRGGDHVMFMGLTGKMAQGTMVPVTLVFEKAGEIVVEIPVDLDRKEGMTMDHSKMGNDNEVAPESDY